MKANKAIIILLLSSAIVGYAQRPAFLYKRKISNIPMEGWYSLAIPVAMFSHIDNNFNDIRLYSISENDTVEIPYLLKIKADQVSEENIELPVFNKSKKNGELFFTFDTSDHEVNYLDLSFVQKNFNAFVKIEGSDNARAWYELVNNQRILSIHNELVQYRATKVHFPTSKYRYLRIAIKSDIPLELLNASFKNETIKPGVINNTTPSWTTQKDNKNKQTIVNIKLAHILPISKLEINALSDLDYYRSFTLEYASDSSKTPKGWTVFYTPLYQGYLTSFNPNVFNFNYQLIKKLRLIIDDQDNPPLMIKGIVASGPEVALLAKLKPSDTYVFYGNRTLESPSYDLIHFEEKIPEALPNISLGEEETISQHVESSGPLFSNKQWLWGAMIITIGVLGYFTLRMMRGR